MNIEPSDVGDGPYTVVQARLHQALNVVLVRTPESVHPQDFVSISLYSYYICIIVPFPYIDDFNRSHCGTNYGACDESIKQ